MITHYILLKFIEEITFVIKEEKHNIIIIKVQNMMDKFIIIFLSIGKKMKIFMHLTRITAVVD